MGSTLGHRNHPGLRKRRTLTFVHLRPTKEPVVVRAVSQIERSPINSDQTTPRQKRTWCVNRRDRASDLTEHRLNRSGPQPDTGLGNRRLRRQLPGLLPTRGPRQTVGQQRQHIHIGAVRIQRHTHRVIGHHPRWQRPMTLLLRAGVGNHPINDVTRERPRQHTNRHQIRQTTIRLGLQLSSTRHPPKLHPCNPNWTVLALARLFPMSLETAHYSQPGQDPTTRASTKLGALQNRWSLRPGG